MAESQDNKRNLKIIWDDSRMQMTYANVCNVSSTKEEFNLLFGTNQSWARGQGDVRVQLTNRVILNPHAAKRLAVLLSNTVSWISIGDSSCYLYRDAQLTLLNFQHNHYNMTKLELDTRRQRGDECEGRKMLGHYYGPPGHGQGAGVGRSVELLSNPLVPSSLRRFSAVTR